MDNERYQAELRLLTRKFPSNAFRFFNAGPGAVGEPYLRIGAKTNSGNVYTFHMDLSSFPMSQPKVFVTRMLKDACGNDMDCASRAMHTLTAENGWTRICHYGPSSWTPAVSLYKVYVKCRLWLEMYEAHLRTGKPLDYWLNHQS